MLNQSNGSAPPEQGGARVPPDAAFDSTAATEGASLTVTPRGAAPKTRDDEGGRLGRHRIVLAYIRALGPVVTAVMAAVATLVGALVR